MAKRPQSPFDHFWQGPNNRKQAEEPEEEEKKEEEQPPADWGTVWEEVNKTWKTIYPMIKPMVNKFKK
ncbi:hypothetical protein CEH05_06525 [Halobacillus halophilus]|uniref:Uncharacterized protein n=1 Tax=Halobacillus halophilus (strain ATCC 35676 / DSM 2266 / JCM 20832 / KCTC 3685 / LMG 17431 / NBRC 102448 / NCIMB 2269) TaxID=866895 RepID=I0JKH4_HALH3|nr:hypothetical protein [Halobacillus halophilus]ASF38786.1 hypothetical protein CEH05_06525 [Halobacillus halophilus]CCG44643.1 hypothetical protein HBHAL_2294 [Halobacillus halophilus DSM 2266]